MFKKYFNSFLHYAVLTLLVLCFIYSIIFFPYSFYISKLKVLSILIIVSFPLIIFFCKKYFHKLTSKVSTINNTKKLLFILSLALLLRLLWIVLAPTIPISDFGLMYKTAGDVANGNYSAFHGYAYFARFAHNTITVLYFSLFYNLTPNPLFLIKLMNVLCQTTAVYALYLAVKEVIDEDKAIIGAFIMAVFPPFIIYTSEIMSENMAMPFYLLSIYLFLSVVKGNKKKTYLLLAGLTLSAANMFRMVGIVFLVAFIMYSLIYKGFKEGIKSSSLLLIGVIVPTFLVSQALISSNITETHLWRSKEPSITSVLRGTNIEAAGHWNTEDAKIPDLLNNDPERIKEVSKSIIIKRLTTTPLPKLVYHYVRKLMTQWGRGDFAATNWALAEVYDTPSARGLQYISSDISFAVQLIYLVILYRAFAAIKNKRYNDIEEFNFFYILLGGFVLFLLLTEIQERYAFIVSWSFIVFAVQKDSILKKN